jgi:hypothetical protein
MVENFLSRAGAVSPDPQKCRKIIEDLRRLGFDEGAFRRLHHWRDKVERQRHKNWLSAFYKYCGEVKTFREDNSNHWVQQRLTYVLLSGTRASTVKNERFETLAEEAYRLIPTR